MAHPHPPEIHATGPTGCLVSGVVAIYLYSCDGSCRCSGNNTHEEDTKNEHHQLARQPEQPGAYSYIYRGTTEWLGKKKYLHSGAKKLGMRADSPLDLPALGFYKRCHTLVIRY